MRLPTVKVETDNGYKIINAADFDEKVHVIFDPDKKYNKPVKLSKTNRKKVELLRVLADAGVDGYSMDDSLRKLQNAVEFTNF